MAIHDWSRIFAGAFHDFHQAWMVEIRNRLNSGLLPDGFYAATEQVTGSSQPDVVALEMIDPGNDVFESSESAGEVSSGGLLFELAPPKARFEIELELDIYAEKADRIAVRHRSGNKVVAVIEIVSPGNKRSRAAFEKFHDKVMGLTDERVHLLIVDLFPPGTFDPHGLPRALAMESDKVDTSVTKDEPYSLIAIRSSDIPRYYIELAAVGAPVPAMPLFLTHRLYINVPLEETYQAAWIGVPRPWKEIVEGH